MRRMVDSPTDAEKLRASPPSSGLSVEGDAFSACPSSSPRSGSAGAATDPATVAVLAWLAVFFDAPAALYAEPVGSDAFRGVVFFVPLDSMGGHAFFLSFPAFVDLSACDCESFFVTNLLQELDVASQCVFCRWALWVSASASETSPRGNIVACG